jgi:tetratricopeptide (TPR) repeat protein
MSAENKPSQPSPGGGATKTTPPPISPAKRKRLQQAFEAANTQMRQENYDYASDMFTQCVLGDPANPVYVQSFLGNLRQKYNNNKKGDNLAFFKVVGSRGMVKKAQMQKDWLAVLKSGVDVLKSNPWHVGTLKAMAAACQELGFGESQLHFLKMALERSLNDLDVNRLCARALKDRKMFDQAIACWHRVEKVRPGDEEAQRAISSLAVEKTISDGQYGSHAARAKLGEGAAGDGADLTPEQRLERDIRRNPKDIQKYIDLAELHTRDEQFVKAAEVYARAIQLDQSNLDLMERCEDVQMREVRKHLAAAEKAHRESGREPDRERFETLKRQVFEKELELAKNRVERYPNNLQFKFQLAERYKILGQYSEAIAEYQAARNDPKYRGLCLLALGQCFTKIKKYRLAMRHFEDAIQEIPERDADNRKKAYYLAGKLAVAMRDVENGERHLTSLAALDFSYRDVAVLLDKIADIRKNMETQAHAPPQPAAGSDQGVASPQA